MKKLLSVCLLAISFHSIANDLTTSDEIKNIIEVSKTAGMCSAYKQIADFQIENKMTGGDEFVNAFGSKEVSSLGMSIPEFTEMCKNAINAYNAIKREYSHP